MDDFYFIESRVLQLESDGTKGRKKIFYKTKDSTDFVGLMYPFLSQVQSAIEVACLQYFANINLFDKK